MKKFISFFYLLVSILLFGQSKDAIKQIDDKIAVYSKAKFENKEKELTEVYYQAKDIDYKKGQINALLLLCNYYINKKESYDEIIEKGRKAEKIADYTDDYVSLSVVKSYIGTAFAELGLLEESRKKLIESIKYSHNISDREEKNIINYNNHKYLAEYYQFQNKKDSVFYHLTNLFQISKEISVSSIYKNDFTTQSHLKLAEFYITENIPDKAISHLNAVERIHKNHFLEAEFLFLMGKALSLKKDDEKVLDYYVRADSAASKIGFAQLKARIYDDIANYYNRKKDLKQYIKYLKESRKIKNSLDEIKKSQIDRIDLNDYNQSSFSKENKTYIVFFIIVFCLTIFVFYKKNIFLRKSSIQNTEDHGPDLIEKISISELTLLANEKKPAFYSKFKEVFPDFEDNILRINPTLKSLDLEICAYIKLHFSTKQIASIKNTSVRAIEGRKYRIRKALHITQDENMYVWFSNI